MTKNARRPALSLLVALALVLEIRIARCAEPAPAKAPAPDLLQLRGGSVLKGQVGRLYQGVLKFKVLDEGEEDINWFEVVGITSAGPLDLLLRDGERLSGKVEPGPTPSLIRITPSAGGDAVTLPIRKIAEINPPPSELHWKASLGLTAAVSDGNTNTRTLGLLGELEARTLRHRWTADGFYNYQDDDSGVRGRSARGRAKYDWFFLPRWYTFAGGLFEHDRFRDLELRSVYSAGLGHQFVERGDYPGELANGIRWLNGIDLSAEAGLAYFVEDYRRASNESYLSAKWSARMDWQLVPSISIFHRHEGFPSLEDAKDLYIITQQGVRVSLHGGLFAAFQANWDWDNTPAKGFDRSEVLYIASLGYQIEL